MSTISSEHLDDTIVNDNQNIIVEKSMENFTNSNKIKDHPMMYVMEFLPVVV